MPYKRPDIPEIDLGGTTLNEAIASEGRGEFLR